MAKKKKHPVLKIRKKFPVQKEKTFKDKKKEANKKWCRNGK